MGIQSYITRKAKVRKSHIHGFGLFAVKLIKSGEIVAIKGGHIIREKMEERVPAAKDESYIQIEDKFYIGPIRRSEVKGNKLFLNHSCEPNVGIRGQITFVAMRDIEPGEELTYDWAMENAGGGNWKLKCKCGSKLCRDVITGNDWKNPVLQKRYKGFFSVYIGEKVAKQKGKR